MPSQTMITDTPQPSRWLNTPARYGDVAKLFHWTLAMGFIFMLGLGFFLDSLPAPWHHSFSNLHKSLGFILLCLMSLRLGWRLCSPTPKLTQHCPRWQQMASYVTHWGLYIAFIIMPLSGWVMASAVHKMPRLFGWLPIQLPLALNKPLAHNAFTVHAYLAWILLALVSLHILAALKHHFINRDHVLRHMWWR